MGHSKFTCQRLYLFRDIKLEILSTSLQPTMFTATKAPLISFINQPEEDEDGDDEDDEDVEDGLLASPPPCSVNLTNDDDAISFSLSFLLPVQTDLWAGLNCHVTFFVVDDCSAGVTTFVGVVTGLVAMGTACVTAMVVVTPLAFLALLLLLLSCSLKSSLRTSGSVVSSNMSQPNSPGSRLGRAIPADLLTAAEILEERLGSESDRSESQSLSPATEPQPSTDTSTGPDPELSESDSLGKKRHKEKYCTANASTAFYQFLLQTWVNVLLLFVNVMFLMCI